MKPQLGIATLLTAASLAGCTGIIPSISPDDTGDDLDEGGGGDSPSTDSAEGKLSSNGLALDFAALATAELGALGSWRTDLEAVAAAGSLGSLDLDHVEYLALCALDQGTSLVLTDPADPAQEVSFPGLYGLAPEWVSDGCGASCQRWMTACLLAHANALGYEVTLSMRGPSGNLAWNDEIVGAYTVQEGAFYGNAFDRSEVVNVYACAGRALVDFDDNPSEPEVDESSEYLTRRICAAGACGLQLTGPCHHPVELVTTCTADAGHTGFFGDCRASAGGSMSGAPLYGEVVTTYLAPE